MAAPSYIGVSNNVFVAASGPATTVTLGGLLADDLIIGQSYIHVAGNFVDYTSIVNIEDLNGVANAKTDFAAAAVGASSSGTHELKMGRAIANGTCSWDVADGGAAVPLWARFYVFRGVTTFPTVAENAFAFPEITIPGGKWSFHNGTSTTMLQEECDSIGNDRLGVSFICFDHNQAIAPYSGASGGTWTEPTPEFASASGTTATIGMNIVDMPTPANVTGGSITITSDEWSTVQFALIPKGQILRPDADVAVGGWTTVG